MGVNNGNKNAALFSMLSKLQPDLAFQIVEIGALPLGDKAEPFHELLDFFPKSTITAFEVDEQLCEELNAKTPDNIRFYPFALGEKDETRPFYITAEPMCSSLYKPIEELADKYTNMDCTRLKAVEEITTTSLDNFASQHGIVDIDFIKIDIQGAELEVFRSGTQMLAKTVFIVSEVEFIPQYHNQPLFGDVCNFLAGRDIMFHKFYSFGGRTIKGVTMNNNPNFPSQHMWSDAVFFRNIFNLSELSPEKLLKMGTLAFIYGSPDVTFHCFQLYDQAANTDLADQFMRL